MTARAHVDGDLLVLPVTKAVMVVPLAEIERLIVADAATWTKAVKRGKSWRRAMSTRKRAGGDR